MSGKYLSLTLSITESGKKARKETFTQESVTVGSGATADLKIEGEGVSDIHAMFDGSRGSEISLVDLGSSSGTFVNDSKVNKQTLEVGNSIKLGDVEIEVLAVGEELTEPVAAVVTEEATSETTSEEATEVKAEDVTPEPEKVEAKEEAKKEEPKAEKVEEKVEAKGSKKQDKKQDKKQAKKNDKKSASSSSKDDEKQALADKKAIFEAKKAKARSKKVMYDLDAIPLENKPPKSKRPILEAREVLWGDTLLTINHYKKPINVTFGEKKGSTFFLGNEMLPSGDSFVAGAAANGGFALNFSKSMEGVIQENGSTFSFEEAISKKKAISHGDGYQITLKNNMAITYTFGEVKYYFRYVDPEKLDKVAWTKKVDYPITTLMVLMFLSYTLLTIYIKSLPAPEIADILDAPDRFAKLVLEEIDMDEPPPPPEEEEQAVIDSAAEAMGEEGKIGEEESVVDKAEGTARKRLEDEKVANSSGILGALDKGMENMDRLFGGGGLGAGLEKTLGMLEGISGVDMRGAGGLGSRGSGLGGGGTALGIGGLGTKGRGGGRGHGRYGVGQSGRLKKQGSNINIRTGNPTIAGALDKSIIARIIKKHYSQIRYCYQRELTKNPKLYGKISIRFTISGKGTVSSSMVKVSTMKNFNVEQCVAKTIRRIIFPQPKGGGIVVVTYPFIFKAGD